MARRRYQKGSIRQRGKRDPVWEVLFWTDIIKSDGSFGRKQESRILGRVSEMTKRQAMKAAEELLRPMNLGKVTPLSSITFRAFVEKHFSPNVFPTLKISTRNRYRDTLKNHLLPAFGEHRLCDIHNLDVQTFVLQKMDKGLSWGTADHHRNLISRIYRTAKKWGFHAGENPAAEIELPPRKFVKERHVLTPEQIPALLRVLREPFRTMVRLAILTGLRVGEILGLQWEDLNLKSAELRVNQRWYRGNMDTPKTKSSRRTLPLPLACVDALQCLQARSKRESGLIFQSRNGHPLCDSNILRRELKPAGKKVGAPWLSWHTFRRTHATLLQLAGGSLKDAQAQLGHTQLSTTLEIYTLPLPAHQREAVENLSRLLTNVDELPKFAERPQVLTERIQ